MKDNWLIPAIITGWASHSISWREMWNERSEAVQQPRRAANETKQFLNCCVELARLAGCLQWAAFLFHFIPTNQSIKQTFLFELNDCWWNEESSPPFAKQIQSIQSINFSFKEKSELISLMICWRCWFGGQPPWSSSTKEKQVFFLLIRFIYCYNKKKS